MSRSRFALLSTCVPAHWGRPRNASCTRTEAQQSRPDHQPGSWDRQRPLSRRLLCWTRSRLSFQWPRTIIPNHCLKTNGGIDLVTLLLRRGGDVLEHDEHWRVIHLEQEFLQVLVGALIVGCAV